MKNKITYYKLYRGIIGLVFIVFFANSGTLAQNANKDGFQAAGNKGVGFALKEHRNSSWRGDILSQFTMTNNQHLMISNLTSNGDIIFTGSGALTELFRIKANGNLGVGTNNPAERLHVKGGFRIDNNSGTPTFYVDKTKELVFVGSVAYNQRESSKIQQNHFSLWVSKGVVSEDFAIINPSDWADYVFDEDYTLRTIEEVESFIKTNGHLPGIPSEAEVKQQGYSLHIINTKLLEKIEELTLYTIEQEKKIKRLEQQNTDNTVLEERLNRLEQLVGN